MTFRTFWTLVVLAVAPAVRAGDLEVTDIKAVHRHGQTFVTWKDVAEGKAGSKFRYSLYRSGQPITAGNLPKAELCYHGVLNCSGKLFGHAFYMKDRLNPAKPYAIIEEGGKPLPPWSGLAVHTVQKPGKAYYAVVATDEKLKPVSVVMPGKSATTKAVDKKPGPIQPIKLYDSKERKSYVAQTSITGKKGLPLSVSLHGSQATGGPAGEWGDYYLYFGTPAMGYRDGLPGVFTVQENRPKSGNHLLLWPRDAIEHPSGRGAFETMWLGYYCIPQGATHKEPRYYRFTENRLLWMIDWSIQRYGADPQRISMGGSSMGGLGSINVGFRHPELFAAAYPSTAPFLWWPPSSLHGLQKRDTKALMADGKTSYVDHTNSPKFAAEHHEDMPFLGWAVGRRDPNHNWQEYVDMVKALTTNHHGFCFAWNDGGHSEGGRPMATITKYYPAAKFARNRSYPAFGNSSIDSKLGSGSKDEGDREGGINLGFEWKDVVDEQGKWSVTVSNDLAKEAMTVDVTPRRCQEFKVKPGTECKWTASTGTSGMVSADQWGLVTVPSVVIQAGKGTVLTIQKAPKIKPAIERGLSFVKEDALKWRKERECATCHHGTMTVWAMNEAKAQGYAVAAEDLADMTKWTKDRLLKDIAKPRDARPGWSMVNSSALMLSAMAQAVPTQASVTADEFKAIAGHLLRHQEADGSWAWSSAPAKNRPPPFFESDEVATLLGYMALGPHGKTEKSPEREARVKAAAWLAKQKPNDTTQAAAYRLLVKVREGEKKLDADIADFLRRQNKDGGFGQLKYSPSDAYATGQALYILSLAGVKNDRADIQRGVDFLLATQKQDGSWPMTRRGHPGVTPGPFSVPIIYFGSTWATLGLMRAAPK